MSVAYTGSSGHYDCLELPIELLIEEMVTEIKLLFGYVLQNNFPLITKTSLVYKKNNGNNIVLKFGKRRGKFHILSFPKNFCLTKSDIDSKKFFVCVTYDHGNLTDQRTIVKWIYTKMIISESKELINLPLIKYVNVLNNNFLKLRSSVYSSHSSFIICSDVKNQYLVITITPDSITPEYHDFGAKKKDVIDFIDSEVKGSRLTLLGNYELFYDERNFKFYTPKLELMEFNLLNGENSLCITDDDNMKSFPYRSKSEK
jgi:hypothetical protein